MLDIDLQNWIHFFPGHPLYETLISLKNSVYDNRNTEQEGMSTYIFRL